MSDTHEPPDAEDPIAGGGEDLDADSEPRRKWRPNAELLRALADARKDLKPGESSLFWDWTATREAAPEAEEMRPSGEGEVFVCDKEAAAAYIAPVQVAPARPPRQSTKSRIRVREDVDPRRQPTVKTRAGGDVHATWGTGSWRPGGASAAFRDASDSAPPSERQETSRARAGQPASCVAPRWATVGATITGRRRASERPRFTPSDPPPYTTRAIDRRRRLSAAIVIGLVAGGIGFFWLRWPRERDTIPAPVTAPCATTSAESAPIPTAARGEDAPAKTTADAATTSAPSAERRDDRGPPRARAAEAKAPVARPADPAPARDEGSERGHGDALAPRKTGFLIRKKDSN